MQNCEFHFLIGQPNVLSLQKRNLSKREPADQYAPAKQLNKSNVNKGLDPSLQNSWINCLFTEKVEERIKNLDANIRKVEANLKVEINTKFVANHITGKEMVKGVPIHWGLVGLEENDPYLIESIKNSVLWPPSSPNEKLNLRGDDIKGQYGQPDYVEKILKENDLWNKNGCLLYINSYFLPYYKS